MTDSGPEYFIHYTNWRRTWDEWVDENRVIEVNNINLAHMNRFNGIEVL